MKERRKKWEGDQLAKFAAFEKEPPKNWREKYVEPTPPNTNGLPELPDGWCWVSVEQCCEYITKGTTPPPAKLLDGKGDIPFIKIYNLTKNGTLDFTIKPTFISRSTHTQGVMVRSCVLPGDVLMNIVGPPLGKVSIVPDTFQEWNVNQAIAIFRPLSDFNNRYLCNCLLTDGILRWATRQGKATAGQFNLTLEIVRRLPMPLSPLNEQQEITHEVDERLSVIAAAETAIDHGLLRAARLRQSILKQAFEGKLVPQDPKDEPASVLLERVKAECKTISSSGKLTESKRKRSTQEAT